MTAWVRPWLGKLTLQATWNCCRNQHLCVKQHDLEWIAVVKLLLLPPRSWQPITYEMLTNSFSCFLASFTKYHQSVSRGVFSSQGVQQDIAHLSGWVFYTNFHKISLFGSIEDNLLFAKIQGCWWALAANGRDKENAKSCSLFRTAVLTLAKWMNWEWTNKMVTGNTQEYNREWIWAAEWFVPSPPPPILMSVPLGESAKLCAAPFADSGDKLKREMLLSSPRHWVIMCVLKFIAWSKHMVTVVTIKHGDTSEKYTKFQYGHPIPLDGTEQKINLCDGDKF